jgi:ubiquitin carboxyl-terminal hydrolase 34
MQLLHHVLQEGGLLDLNEIASHVAGLTVSHGYLERRHNTVEDDGLIGLLTLATAVIRHNPPFKSSSNGQVRYW